MYSIVCPTMWRGIELATMFPNLLPHKLVGEIIIIDNDITHRPQPFWNYLDNPKLKVINHNTNTFVNPAWKLGVETASFDRICLLSDDVLFHTDLLEMLHPHLTEDAGIFGCDPDWVNPANPSRKPLVLKECTDAVPPMGFGMLMFLNKAAWSDVPPEFKIFYGDNWIYVHNAVKRKAKNYLIGNDVMTRFKTTSRDPVFNPQADFEHNNAERIFAEHFGPGIYNSDEERHRAMERIIQNYGAKKETYVRGHNEEAGHVVLKSK